MGRAIEHVQPVVCRVGDIEPASWPVHRRVIEAARILVGGKQHFPNLLENHDTRGTWRSPHGGSGKPLSRRRATTGRWSEATRASRLL